MTNFTLFENVFKIDCYQNYIYIHGILLNKKWSIDVE